MSVSNGQDANQTTFNDAFMSRTAAETSTSAKVDLENAEPESGDPVENLQREVNSLNSMLGRTAGSDFDASPEFVANEGFDAGDDVIERVEKVSELADKDTGHSHNGDAGGGAPIKLQNTTSLDQDDINVTAGYEPFADGSGGVGWQDPPHGFRFTTVRTTIADNTGSPTSVTGMDCSAFQSVIFFVEIVRMTATVEKSVVGTLTCRKRFLSSAWEIIPDLKGDGDSDGGDAYDGAGVTFSITSAGQVKYVSDDMAGSSYVGIITYRGMTFNPPTPDLF